jgi:glycosyltransferase involved in cell wall biosynthesis
MKVLQIVTQMEAGGAQRVAMLLADALRDRGYDSEVCFLYLKRPTYLNDPHAKVLLSHPPIAVSSYVKIALKLRDLLNSYRPDVLITHTHYANILGQLMARCCGIPTRIAVQHNPVQTYPKVARVLDLILGSTGFYSTNVAVSQAVIESAKSYPTRYQHQLCKIHNGLPVQQPVNFAEADIRLKYGLPADAPLLIHVGRLSRQKNQTVLLEALRHLPNVHLLLVGDGELREALQQQANCFDLASRVHFCGELPSIEVLALLSIADLFVFPSLYEAMPMAIIEAMSLGLPIVGSDIAALREVIGDAGVLVPAHRDAIGQAVQQILNSPPLKSQLRHRALERSRMFSIKKMVAAYETLFY